MRKYGIHLILLIVMLLTVSLSAIMAQESDSLLSQLNPDVLSEDMIALELEVAYSLEDTDTKKAVSMARNALNNAHSLELHRWIAEANLALGSFFNSLGQQEEAAEHLMQAHIDFVLMNDSLKQASTLTEIGKTYFSIRQYEPALKYYKMVRDFGYELKDTSLIISGINAVASVYGNTAKMDSALILSKEALRLARESKDIKLEIQAYFYIGDIHLYSGRRTQALAVFSDLERYYNLERDSPRYLASLYNSMTKAYLEKSQLKKAREYSEKTRQVLESQQMKAEYGEYYYHLYKINDAEQQFEEALQHHIRYKEITDSVNNAEYKERLAKQEIAFDLLRVENQVDLLTMENELKDLEIAQKRKANYGYAILSLLLIVAIIFMIRSNLKVRDKNIQLNQQSEHLKNTQQKLVQSEKMASIGTLTAGIAHEINNPLNFISGGLGIIKDLRKKIDWTGKEDEKKKFETASSMAADGLDRAVNIVRSMMTFSHKGGARPTQTDLNEIIDNTLLFLKSKIADDIRITKNYKLYRKVNLYPEKMHQVMMNLIDNAIYAVGLKEKGPKTIEISTEIENNRLVLSIRNSGPRIDVDHLPQLFDPFFTTRDPGDGTGLGLSICYTLVKDHAGEIQAKNLSNGVEFRVSIPVNLSE